MADTGQLQVQREVTEKAIGGEDARLGLTDPERGRGAQGGDAPLDLIDRSRLDLHANGKPLGPGPLHHRGYAEFIGFAAAVIGEGNGRRGFGFAQIEGAADNKRADGYCTGAGERHRQRSEEHTSELESLMRSSYADFGL